MTITKEKLKSYSEVPNYSDIEAIGFWDDVHNIQHIHTICSVVDDPETGEEVVLVFHDHPDLCGTGAPRCVLKIFDEDIGVMSWMPQVFC